MEVSCVDSRTRGTLGGLGSLSSFSPEWMDGSSKKRTLSTVYIENTIASWNRSCVVRSCPVILLPLGLYRSSIARPNSSWCLFVLSSFLSPRTKLPAVPPCLPHESLLPSCSPYRPHHPPYRASIVSGLAISRSCGYGSSWDLGCSRNGYRTLFLSSLPPKLAPCVF